MNDHSGYFAAHADDISRNGLLDDKSVSFYRDLLELQDLEYQRYSSLPSIPAIGGQNIPLSQNHGAILTDDLLSSVAAGVRPLGGLMAKHHPGLSLEPLLEPMAGGALSLREPVSAFLAMDYDRLSALSAQYKTGIEECIFMLTNILRPLLSLLRERSTSLISAAGSPLRCPFCGQYPDMSLIGGGEEGKRFLHCSLCGHRWPFKRIACAVCGTEDASKLEYLSAEGDTRYRIDVCRECGGYIKTVRLDKFEESEGCDLMVENIMTAGLDGAAMREGYRRP